MTIGYLFAICTTLFWTMSALCFEAASKRVGSIAVNILRLVLALFLLSCITFYRTGSFGPIEANEHQWRWLIASGFVGFFIGDIALFRAYVLIGARLTTLLMVLAAPFGAIGSLIMIGETLTPLKIAGMCIALSGVAWVCAERRESDGTPHHHRILGTLLGIVAAFGQGFGAVLMKIGRGNLNGFEVTQVRVLAGTAGFLVLLPMIRKTRDVVAATRHPTALGFLTAGAVMGPVLGVSCYAFALLTVPVGIVGTIAAMVPVTIIPFAIFLKKERVSVRAVFGAIIAVIGVVLLCL
jgi:drug/metabolite transporter (DMT)-like permease